MSFLLGQLREKLGDDLTLALLEAHGGRVVYVPKEPREGQDLAALLGLDGARKLAQLYGGENLPVPVGRNFRIDAHTRAGLSVPEISRRVGAGERAVRLARQTHGIKAQLDLFDAP